MPAALVWCGLGPVTTWQVQSPPRERPWWEGSGHVWEITGPYFRFLGREVRVGLPVKRRDTEEIWGRKRTELTP